MKASRAIHSPESLPDDSFRFRCRSALSQVARVDALRSQAVLMFLLGQLPAEAVESSLDFWEQQRAEGLARLDDLTRYSVASNPKPSVSTSAISKPVPWSEQPYRGALPQFPPEVKSCR